jgi:hypothetical protein
MSLHAPLQPPLRLTGAAKTEPRTQFAVLPWRLEKGKVKVCLVTSRGTGRWILPKGWPMDDTTPAKPPPSRPGKRPG